MNNHTLEFIFGLVIWHDLLYTINTISKLLPSESMKLDVTQNELRGLMKVVENCRENGFVLALITAK